jgi:hypothetical protein
MPEPITIPTTTYNHAKYLEVQIRELAAQHTEPGQPAPYFEAAMALGFEAKDAERHAMLVALQDNEAAYQTAQREQSRNERAIEVAEYLQDAASVHGDCDLIADHVMRLHRTEQQNVFRLIYAIVKATANPVSRPDPRNEASHRVANEMLSGVDTSRDGLPYV